MLKRTEEAAPPESERPVGEIVHELIEDGKAYARAELGVAKAIATAKAKALALPAGLFFGALLLAQAAVTVLAVTVLAALSTRLGPVAAGLIAVLLFAGVGAALAWYGVQRVKRDL